MGRERERSRRTGGWLHALFAPLVVMLASSGHRPVQAADGTAADDAPRFLARYCVDCHSGDRPEGDVELVLPADDAALQRERRLWEAAVRRVEAGEMPPADHDRPDREAAAAFARAVRSRYEKADLLAPPSPGRVTMRRLNRNEYRNTIRDLVGVDFDPTEDFPSDDIGHGFDTIGDVLTVSPLLLDRYLGAAEAVMERAIPLPTPAVVRRWRPAMFTEPASPDVPRLIVEGFRRMTTDSRESIELGPINVPFEWEADGAYEFRARVYAAPDGPLPVRVTVLVSGSGVPSPTSDAELDRFSGFVPRPAKILQSVQVTATSRQSNDLVELRIPPMPGRERMLLAIERPAAGAPPATVFIDGMALDGPLDPRP
ncbi:MAG: DUF1587 domain-containing protein, partial [Planctomycetia bacterium]|nr:DUF1587 domain-containing protein [Planctomycetia bacterium]